MFNLFVPLKYFPIYSITSFTRVFRVFHITNFLNFLLQSCIPLTINAKSVLGFFQTFWGLSLSLINPTSSYNSDYSNLCGTVEKVLKNDFKKSRRHIQDLYFYAFLREEINFWPCWRQIWVEMSKYLIFMLLLCTFDHFC